MDSHQQVKVFISYSHKDDVWRQQLVTHMSGLDYLDVWHDRHISAGDEWDKGIHGELQSADIILLLISSDFMSSGYIKDTEIVNALRRHDEGTAVVVPVLIRDCLWKELPVAKFQAFPADEKWVTSSSHWDTPDQALKTVVVGIRDVAEKIMAKRQREVEDQMAAQETYRKKVAEMLSDGVITRPERDTLDELQEDLGLTDEEAQEIEDGESLPLEEKRRSLARYEKSIVGLVEDGMYPLSDELRSNLEDRRKGLGLSADDVDGLEERIIAAVEAKQLSAESQAAAEAERLAAEEAEAAALAERHAQAEAERLAKEKADRLATEEAEREANRIEAERIAQEEATAATRAEEERQEAERLVREEAEERARGAVGDWAMGVVAILDNYVDVFAGAMAVSPKIPAKVAAKTRKDCAIPAHDIVLGRFGDLERSEEGYLAFGLLGMYFSDGAEHAPDGHHVPYRSLPAMGDDPFELQESFREQKGDVEFAYPWHDGPQSQDNAIVELLWDLRMDAEEYADELSDAERGIVAAEDSAGTLETVVGGLVAADSKARAQSRRRWVEALTKLLGKLASDMYGLLVDPDIPEKKQRNAWERYEIPASEKPLGLIDTTLMGSAKEGLVFGIHGVYLHNPGGNTSPGAHFVSYDDFPSTDFAATDGRLNKYDVRVGDVYFCTAGGLTAEDTVTVFSKVRDLFEKHAGANPA